MPDKPLTVRRFVTSPKGGILGSLGISNPTQRTDFLVTEFQAWSSNEAYFLPAIRKKNLFLVTGLPAPQISQGFVFSGLSSWFVFGVGWG